jgi:hypothetical protein
MPRKQVSDKDIIVSASAPTRRKPVSTTRTKRATPIATTPAPVTQPMQQPAPSREDVALQAYLYWEARGFRGGSPEEDWLRAEQELAAKPSIATSVA